MVESQLAMLVTILITLEVMRKKRMMMRFTTYRLKMKCYNLIFKLRPLHRLEPRLLLRPEPRPL
jgi:hypothetical protein